MHNFWIDLLAVLVTAVFFKLGWIGAHDPQRVYRFFNFGLQTEWKFFIIFIKVWGWMCVVVFSIGTIVMCGRLVYHLFQ